MTERAHAHARDVPSVGPDRRDRPRLAVLIPVFNDQRGLAKALASLAQDGAPFDVFVVDDGSDPPTRIPPGLPYEVRILRQAPNQGITAALNAGLARIAAESYEYVARLDAGDLSLPGRLAAQAAFLDDHPEHAAVGTATRHVDLGGRVLYDFHPPTEHSEIVRGLRYHATLVHPSIMLRLEAVQACGLYEDRFPGGEDYDLFFRLAKMHKLANLERTYVVKEISPFSITSNRRKMLLRRLGLLAWHFDARSVHSYLGLAANALAILVPRRLIFGLRRWSNGLRLRRRTGSGQCERMPAARRSGRHNGSSRLVISILSVGIFGDLLHEPDVWTGRVRVLMLREHADLIRDLQPGQVFLDDGSHAWPTVRSVPLLDQKPLR